MGGISLSNIKATFIAIVMKPIRNWQRTEWNTKEDAEVDHQTCSNHFWQRCKGNSVEETQAFKKEMMLDHGHPLAKNKQKH